MNRLFTYQWFLTKLIVKRHYLHFFLAHLIVSSVLIVFLGEQFAAVALVFALIIASRVFYIDYKETDTVFLIFDFNPMERLAVKICNFFVLASISLLILN